MATRLILGVLVLLIASPASPVMAGMPGGQRGGEPARVQQERIRHQVAAVREQLRLRAERALAAKADKTGRAGQPEPQDRAGHGAGR